MVDRTPRRLCGSRPARGTTNRWFRPLAMILLLLGVLAWPPLSSLHAQPAPVQAESPRDVAPNPLPTPPPAPSTPGQAGGPPPQGGFQPAPVPLRPPSVERLQIKIDPKTPLKDLLPAPPKVKKIVGPFLGNDLTRVPEVQFQAPWKVVNNEAKNQIAHQIAKINHLNDKKTDGFLDALRGERLDLNGLPFAMGDACRTKGERSRQFNLAVATVRRALQPSVSPPSAVSASSVAVPAQTSVAPNQPASSTVQVALTSGGPQGPGQPIAPLPTPGLSASTDSPDADTFWEQYRTLCSQEERAQAHIDREKRECVTLARVAALMQVLAPMSPEMHLGLVKYLSSVSHVEATRALARLAIFSAEEEVRRTALDALKVRRERDYTDVLTKGLRYPWPTVARRAAEAVAKLERTDLLPQLVELLEAPDPRAPVLQEIKQKQVPVVSELVRVNHHRNCLLCHAPGNTGKVSPDTLTAEVPVPGQPLTPPSSGYNSTQQDILVRLDVTYLRQDFSALQPVADANPWPEMQRFDFLVRTRTLTDDEAVAYREKLAPREEGEFSPYQRAALAALRDLTGRDTEPTAQAWRRLLKLPVEQQRKTKMP
jgi:hypothetical protein